jgi:hypothetical protein
MYFSQISSHTKEHLLSHMAELLANEQSKYGDTIRLVMPKVVDLSSMIGGIMAIATDTLPQYSLDCNSKVESEMGEYNLNTYDYSGQISFLVNGGDPNSCQEIARRHAAALEQFCKAHQFFHQYTSDAGFKIIGFECNAVELQGPMELITESKGNIWVAGGVLDLTWVVSETGYFDHA